MKKIFLAITAVAISMSALAQTDSSNSRMNHNDINKNTNVDPNNPAGTKTGHDMNDHNNMQNTDTRGTSDQAMRKSQPDGYVMQKGKVMTSKSGRMTAMEKEMTFSDGSVLMSDGTIKRKDGTKLMVKDGEYVDMTGKVVRSDKSKDMYLVPDSTKNNK